MLGARSFQGSRDVLQRRFYRVAVPEKPASRLNGYEREIAPHPTFTSTMVVETSFGPVYLRPR